MKFRLQALAHLGEPEELDIAPRLVDPRAWIATFAVLAGLVAALVWSFVAEVPRTVTARGILAPATGLLAVQAPAAGVVTQVSVQLGQPVTAGQQVATVLRPTGQDAPVTSAFAGSVVAVPAAVGQPVTAGTTVLDLRAAGNSSALVAQLFVASGTAAQIAPGMSVLMSVEAAPSAAFGLLKGHVRSVSAQTLSSEQALAVLGNDVLVKRLASSGPQRLVTVVLNADTHNRSGYAWTSSNGPPFPLPAQTLLTATVRIGSQRPIDFVFGH
jgi:multidrug efflux pump subunit AcrA (membrane-fusion protein)